MIIKSPDIGSAGIVKDVPAWELSPPAWSDGSNVRFRNGMAERVPGHLGSYGTIIHVPYGLYPAIDSTGNRYIVYPGLLKIGAAQGTNNYDITRSTGGDYNATADTKWTGGVLNGIVVVNNPNDLPQFWTPQVGGNMAALTNWDANNKCRALRPFKNYLFALDVTKTATRYPYLVMWSAAATPGTLPAWTASPSNDAGETDLGDSFDYLVDCAQIGDQLAIYREQSIYLARYVGGTFVFNFQRVSNESGMLANNCVDAFPGGHVVLGPSDVYVFNGTSTESILDGRMRKWLFQTISSDNYERSFVVSNPRESEAWICFPTSGSSTCDRAIIWNWKANTLGVRDLPSATCGTFTQSSQISAPTWATESGTWADATDTWGAEGGQSLADKAVILGSADTEIHIVGAAETFDGTAITSTLERSGVALGDAQRVKYVRSVWPRIDGAAGDTMEITIGTQMSVDEMVSWGTPKTYTIGTSRKIDVNKSGRFLGIRIRSTGGSTWRLRSFDVDVTPQGLW